MHGWLPLTNSNFQHKISQQPASSGYPPVLPGFRRRSFGDRLEELFCDLAVRQTCVKLYSYPGSKFDPIPRPTACLDAFEFFNFIHVTLSCPSKHQHASGDLLSVKSDFFETCSNKFCHS